MTDEDMKQYLPLWREAMVRAYTTQNCPDVAKDYLAGVYDHEFTYGNETYQAIKLMVEGWKPETKEDVAREMLAKTAHMSHAQRITYLARCLPDGFKIADLPEVEA